MRYSACSPPVPQKSNNDPQQRDADYGQRDHASQPNLVADFEHGGVDQPMYRCACDHVPDVHG